MSVSSPAARKRVDVLVRKATKLQFTVPEPVLVLSVPISAVNAPDMSVSVCPGISLLAFDQAD